MRFFTRIIILILAAGFIAIQFAAVIDDSHHFLEPDPDCPICLAAQTQVYITPYISISYTPNILFYLIDKNPLDPQIQNYCSILSIRAPPLFIS